MNTHEQTLLLAASLFCRQSRELRDVVAYEVATTRDTLVVRLRRLVVIDGEAVEPDDTNGEADIVELIDAWRRGERW